MIIEFFGQHLEDVVLWKFFRNRPPGVYVDVGAHDGIIRSNSYLFEKLGWKGICIEAHPTYAEMCKKNRPKAIVINAAVANENKESVSFYATPTGGFSTLDRSMESYFKSAYSRHFKGYTEVKVPMVTLASVFKQHRIDKVDFISLDIEGSELNALRGIRWKNVRPRIIISEALTPTHEANLREFMLERKYVYAKKLGNNFFFCSNAQDAEAIAQIKRGKDRKITI